MKILRTDPDLFGIRARLLTLLLPGMVGLLALDSWNDYHALSRQVEQAYDQHLIESVNALQGSLSLAPDGAFRLNPPFAVKTASDDSNPPQRRYVHVSLAPRAAAPGGAAAARPGVRLLGETDLPAPPVAAPAASAPPVWYESYYRGGPVRVLALQRQVVDGRGQSFDLLIQAAESTGPRDQAQAGFLQQELLRDARMVGVMILLVWLGVRWSLQPLERLRKSVLQSRAQDLQPLDTREVPHEVAPLVHAINQHIASYRGLLDQQSQFLADASHQLRTPLAIMLTQAGFALREKDPQLLRETLRAIVIQISRSRRLCEQLLSLAHASESSPPADAPEVMDLNTVAKGVVLQYLALAHEKNQDLGWVDALQTGPASGPVVPVLARSPELHEVLSNLVHNAIVYTPSGGQITVSVRTQGCMALAEVCDSGPGIAKARRDAVFERFHQAGPGNAAHGTGLGLAIARAYARRNDGDIELADAGNPLANDPEGTGMSTCPPGLRAILRLPLASGHPR